MEGVSIMPKKRKVRGKAGKSISSSVKGQGRWRNPKIWKAYLDNLTSGEQFTTEGGAQWLTRNVTQERRHKILARIREVDPDSYSKVRSLIASQTAKRRWRKSKKRREEKIANVVEAKQYIEDDKIAMAQKHFEDIGLTQFRFVQADGIMDICAMLRAAGYSVQEISEKLPGVDISLIASVTSEMIREKRKQFADAIILAADQKVYHDMVKGEVTPETIRAEKIAQGRRKLILDATKLKQSGSPDLDPRLTPKQIEDKRKLYEERFGMAKDIQEVESEAGDE